jgi:hypothetical protein
MLQQFLITIFDKLDRGNSWDDEFELNNLLQVKIALQVYCLIDTFAPTISSSLIFIFSCRNP